MLTNKITNSDKVESASWWDKQAALIGCSDLVPALVGGAGAPLAGQPLVLGAVFASPPEHQNTQVSLHLVLHPGKHTILSTAS
jgi:hypothetical protein